MNQKKLQQQLGGLNHNLLGAFYMKKTLCFAILLLVGNSSDCIPFPRLNFYEGGDGGLVEKDDDLGFVAGTGLNAVRALRERRGVNPGNSIYTNKDFPKSLRIVFLYDGKGGRRELILEGNPQDAS